MVTEIQLFQSPDLVPLYFCLWGCTNNEVHKRKEDTRDELLARILDTAAHVKKREDLSQRTTEDLRPSG
jgi:hypothetical protein